MAITPSLLTSGTGTGSTPATASVTPSTDALLLLAISCAATPNAPSVSGISGCGVTWVEVSSTSHASRRADSLWRALGTPTSGTITITRSEGGNTPQGTAWALMQFTGVDTGGTNGSAAVAGSVTANGSSGTGAATITESPAAGDFTYAFLAIEDANATTIEGGWDQRAAVNEDTNVRRIRVADDSDRDQTPSWTFSSCGWSVQALIVKAAASGGGGLSIPVVMNQYRQRVA